MFSLKKEEVNVGRQRELDLVKGFLMIMIILIHILAELLMMQEKYWRKAIWTIVMPAAISVV